MSDARQISAVVLAAGSSRRFGTDKLLHPVTLNGVTMPLAAHSLLPWLDTFSRTTVVVRPGSCSFRMAVTMSLGAAKAAGLRWVECDDAGSGMAASLACGVRANSKAAGWLIGLADMPAVPPAAIAGVRSALLNGAGVAATRAGNRRGHPVGFAAHYYDELQALQGDAGARSLLERSLSSLVHVESRDHGIFADIDTPGDLEGLL